jgi:two-component system response regulator RegX3
LQQVVAGAQVVGGTTVLGVLDDGAAAVGWAVADQPDLLLLEEMLPTVPGREVVRRVREFSPSTVVAVQVGYADDVRPMLEAGAHLAVPRRVPPAELAATLLQQVQVA